MPRLRHCWYCPRHGMRVVANALVALYQVEGDADWSEISDLIGAGSPAGDAQGRRARERRMRPAIRRRDDLRRERGSRRGVFLGRTRAWRPRPARPRPTGVGVACGAEVVAKKDPLLDLLIRGSRVRIPDGSPRNRHVTRRSAGAGSPWCGLSATLPSSSPPQFRSALATARKKKKAADPRARRFLESGSFVSTASLAR